MMRQRVGRWLLGASVSLCLGCGSTVTITEQEREGAGGGGDRPCPELPVVELSLLEEGTFVDGALHVMVQADGGPARWARLDVQPDGIFLREELAFEAPSKLVGLGPGQWARLRPDGTAIERLTFADGRPQREQTYDIDGSVAGGSPLTFANDQLYFCRIPSNGAELGITRLALDGSLEHRSDQACSSRHDGWGASGDVWGAYSGASTSNGVANWFLTAEGAQKGRDFGYNPAGVHAYGSARAAFADGEVAVFDTGSDDYFLLLGGPELSTFAPEGPYITFSPAGPKRLLAVVSGIAYFATPQGFVMVDVGDISQSPRIVGRADVELEVDLVRFVAGGDDHVVFADGDGQALVLPAQPDDRVLEPSVVRRGSPDACR